MGHGYKDGLILRMAGQLLRCNMAEGTAMHHSMEMYVAEEAACMPRSHENTARVIADALYDLHPDAQYTMSCVLFNT